MKSLWRWLRWPMLALLVLGLWAGYRIAYGTPFTINQLANRQAMVFLLSNPELLSQLGLIDGTVLDFHSGKLTPFTMAHRDEDYARLQRFLRELDGFDRARLGPQDRLTWDVLHEFYSDQLALKAFAWMPPVGIYPFEPMNGLQTALPNLLLQAHVVRNAKTARSYVGRLEQVSVVIDQGLEEVSRQRALGVTPPVSVIDKTAAIAADFLRPDPAEHALATHFRNRLEALSGFDPALRAQLEQRSVAALRDRVYPAYRRLALGLADLRGEAARNPADGLARLPDGTAAYAAVLRMTTTSSLPPDEVHAIGLREVERIDAEADAVLRGQGYSRGSVGERLAQLGQDARLQFPSTDEGRQQMLARYREILQMVQQRLPDFFEVIPTQPLTVERVPAFSEKGAPGAYFQPAALDGSRPGTFFANLRDPAETPQWAMKTLAYHEAIPGHFFQISIAQKLEGLPFIRQQPVFTAYVEGWALYAEHLAQEMGMYEGDPLGDLGRLQAELFRAVRLVVDTGLHAKGWSREQAIDYMTAQTGMSRTEVTTEVERYMVTPGQACAYKLGMLKLLQLRERARAALGPRFDLKEYHRVVLQGGALPLDSLEQVVDDWLRSKRTAVAASEPAPPQAAHPMPPVPATVVDWAAGARLFDGLGDFHRRITTDSSQAQQYFDQGMRFLWAFNHDESTRSFARAAQLDPHCAACYWGVALTVGPNYNLPSVAAPRAKVAFEALELARQNGAAGSPVEQALIAALARRYPNAQPPVESKQGPVLTQYAAAMRDVALRFADDPDVQTLYAESLMNVNAWKLWTADGQPAPGTLQIETTLERVLERDPRHPGANHYYVHTMEASPHPEKALAAAERLRGMMPAAGHLEHMPAHILQRVGRYEEAAQANRNGARADEAYFKQIVPPDNYPMYLAHNYEFLAYSAAMEGRQTEALEAVRRARHAASDPDRPVLLEEWAALVRFGQWDDLLARAAPDPKRTTSSGGYLFGKAVALAVKGRVDEAREAVRELSSLTGKLPSDSSVGLNPTRDIFALATVVARARIAVTEHRQSDAIDLLREAVAREDKLAYDEPNDWFFPTRHILGAQLLAAGQPAAAEAVYREDLKRNPENGWALYGLAAALKAQNDATEAARVEQRFRAAWKYADITLTSSAF